MLVRIIDIYRRIPRCSLQFYTHKCIQRRVVSSKPSEDIDNEPIKYSQSKAAIWKAQNSYSGSPKEDKLWYESIVIGLSLTAFMVYFCILREENDIDEKLEVSLYDHVPGLERKQIEIRMKYNEEHGEDNAALKQRLDELTSPSTD